MTDWNRTTLGEVVLEGGGSFKTGPFGTTLKASEYSSHGVPVISVGEVAYGSLVLRRDTPRVSPEVTKRLPEYVLKRGDIVFGRKGAVDRSAWVQPSQEGWFLGSDGIRARIAASADSEFVAYQIRGPHIREWLLQHASGSTLLSLNQTTLSRVPLLIPPLLQQRAVAEVLAALDDKIAVNTRSIETMDRLQRAHFERLRAEGVGELVKVERLVKRLTVARKISKNEAFGVSGHPVFDQSENGHLGFLDDDQYIDASDEQPVLYFGDHTCKLRIATESFFVGPNTIPFVGSGTSALLLFSALRGLQTQQEYKRHWGDLIQKFAFLPSGPSARRFEATFNAQLPLTRGLALENRTLAATRDALLPQLMSGKLRVKDAEKSLAGVL